MTKLTCNIMTLSPAHNDEIPKPDTDTGFVVAALYKFVVLEDLPDWQAELRAICSKTNMMGTLLLATEGLNGTVSARYEDMSCFVEWLRDKPCFSDVAIKYALYTERPFHRMKVRLKKEIVTMGCEDIYPSQNAGTYVEPKDWNALISDPDTMVVDTRNHYETAIGTFEGAVDPNTTNFREFPKWARELADLPAEEKPKKLAMFCTGGIRCEKSTALMRQYGFEDVYHLKGGILKYFEDVPAEESLWKGECFVFDNRVSVDHNLTKGKYELCFACRMPLTEQDREKETYLPGLSCHHCHDTKTKAQKERYEMRQKQVRLAQKRGEQHIGKPKE
ncbi:MAG: rhodanese-related sulfurtransferase [Candidatus Puniceispirillaceae bacterium]